MEIVYDEVDLCCYFQMVVSVFNDVLVLLDYFFDDVVEVDVDVICDGEMVLIGGIMEYIEQVGVYFGDFVCLLLVYILSQEIQDVMCQQVQKLVFELQVCGLMNVQFVVKNNEVYLIEVNLCVVCIVLFVFKVIGVLLVKVVVCVMVGKLLVEQGVIKEVILLYYLVKEVVLLFNKFLGVDLLLGLEMCFIGEVMGVGCIFVEVFVKVQLGSNFIMKKYGCVLFFVCEGDKECVVDLVVKLLKQGFELDVIYGMVIVLGEVGINLCLVNKVYEGCLYIQDCIKNGEYIYIINIILGCCVIEDFCVICCSVL